MQRAMPAFMLFISVMQLIFAIGFFFQVPFFTALWPFPGTTPLTYIFISSILAASVAAQLWVLGTGQYGAFVGIALDYILIFGALALYVGTLGASTGNPAMTNLAIGGIGGVITGLALLFWSRRFPLDNTVPLPPLVRWSFMIFILALFIVSFRLIRQEPNVIPWTITPEIGVVIGCMFLSAAIYFIYTLVRPSWANAAGQLAGFLAYDLVLIGPFLIRLPAVAPEFRVSLWIYTAVVTYSGLLAIYYLFINPQTRLWKGRRAVPAVG